ncbi:type ISP restriction/modification enzyme [Streptomonospora salina]
MGGDLRRSLRRPRARTPSGKDRLRARRSAATGEPVPLGTGLPQTITYLPSEGGEGKVQVGEGEFGPVTERMWAYDVGGTNIIGKWFGYRKADPGGKKTSPLDDVHVATWPKEWISEFNELLTALRRITDLEPEQAELLEGILAGPLTTADGLAAAGVKFPQNPKDRKPRHGLPPADPDSEQGMII